MDQPPPSNWPPSRFGPTSSSAPETTERTWQRPPSLPGPPGLPEQQPPRQRRGSDGSRVGGIVAGIIIVALVGGTAVYIVGQAKERKRPVAIESPVAAAVLEGGWGSVKKDEFSIGLAPGWKSSPISSVDAAFNAFKGDNPKLAAIVKNTLGGSLSSFIRMLAFDTKAPTLAEGFATNMNVVIVPVPIGTTLSEFVDLNVKEFKNVLEGVSNIRQSSTTLPAGPAGKVRASLAIAQPGGGAVNATLVQFYLIHRGVGAVITFTTTPKALAKYGPLWEKIAGTFRFK